MNHATDTDYKPSLISWNLTRRCNLRCPHCYLDAGHRSEHEFTTDECRRLLDELKALGTEMVILTGGEPLLRRDIYEIARHASRLGLWVVMGTNGVLVTDEVAARMRECGVRGVGISIDSVHAEKHDAFRGGPGAWEHSMRALDICRAHGLEVIVQSTVMAMNYDEVDELMALAREKGAWAFNLYFLVRTGRGQELNDLPPSRVAAMLSHLVDAQERNRPMRVRAKCAPQFKQIAFEQGRRGLESGGCMAGTRYARITPDAEVTPCPYMPVVAGDLRRQSFTDVWRSSPVLQQLRDRELLKGRCGRCEFNELCGGCRCRAHAATGDYLDEDPACTYQPTSRALEVRAPAWNGDARARLERIPIEFIRGRVREGVEAYAARRSIGTITPEIMEEALSSGGRPHIRGGFSAFPQFNDSRRKQ
jgi:radical SAM protein with 4Fe4S-binding SPASM domain